MHPDCDVLHPVEGLARVVLHAGNRELWDLVYPTQAQDVSIVERTEDQVHYDDGESTTFQVVLGLGMERDEGAYRTGIKLKKPHAPPGSLVGQAT